MSTEEEKSQLRNSLEQYEGNIEHMYLDSKGYVTVGVGHLISSLTEALKLPFVNTDQDLASDDEISQDYASVKAQPENLIASRYKRHTQLILPQDDIDKLTDKHIDVFEVELEKIYDGFTSFPGNVRLALFDLIFNLGMTNLKNKWPKFNAAIAHRDWQKAALNSNRKAPISFARNKYVRELLENANHTITAAVKPLAPIQEPLKASIQKPNKTPAQHQAISLNSHEHAQMVAHTQQYYKDQFKRNIDLADAENLIEFFSSQLGGLYYNQGLRDAQTYINNKFDDINIDALKKTTSRA